MRTHLLQTILSPEPAAEFDIGRAANEARYESVDPARRKSAPVAPSAPDEHDDYCLGGYAGI